MPDKCHFIICLNKKIRFILSWKYFLSPAFILADNALDRNNQITRTIAFCDSAVSFSEFIIIWYICGYFSHNSESWFNQRFIYRASIQYKARIRTMYIKYAISAKVNLANNNRIYAITIRESGGKNWDMKNWREMKQITDVICAVRCTYRFQSNFHLLPLSFTHSYSHCIMCETDA